MRRNEGLLLKMAWPMRAPHSGKQAAQLISSGCPTSAAYASRIRNLPALTSLPLRSRCHGLITRDADFVIPSSRVQLATHHNHSISLRHSSPIALRSREFTWKLSRSSDAILSRSLCTSSSTPSSQSTPASSSSSASTTTSDESRTRMQRLSDRMKSGYVILKQKKTEYLVRYGASFLLVHELLGISSYVITFLTLYTGLVSTERLLSFIGWTEADLQSKGFSVNDKLITFALTVALVKGLDLVGLVPLRWALCIYITPKVARYIGPFADRLVGRLKSLVRRKTQGSSSTTTTKQPPSQQ